MSQQSFTQIIESTLTDSYPVRNSQLALGQAIEALCPAIDNLPELGKFAPSTTYGFVTAGDVLQVVVKAKMYLSSRFGAELTFAFVQSENETDRQVIISKNLLHFVDNEGEQSKQIECLADYACDSSVVDLDGDWYDDFRKEVKGTLKLLVAEHMEFALELFGPSVDRQALQQLSRAAIMVD